VSVYHVSGCFEPSRTLLLLGASEGSTHGRNRKRSMVTLIKSWRQIRQDGRRHARVWSAASVRGALFASYWAACVDRGGAASTGQTNTEMVVGSPHLPLTQRSILIAVCIFRARVVSLGPNDAVRTLLQAGLLRPAVKVLLLALARAGVMIVRALRQRDASRISRYI
jgi:hypothetical protein